MTRMVFGPALGVLGALMVAVRCATEAGWYTPLLWTGGIFLLMLGGAVIAYRDGGGET